MKAFQKRSSNEIKPHHKHLQYHEKNIEENGDGQVITIVFTCA